MSQPRNWRIGKSGDYRASGGHGPVRVLVANGEAVDRVLRVDNRDRATKVYVEKFVELLKLTEEDIENYLKSLRIRT